MLRRTKIVATIGPATDDPHVLTEMVHEGLDVARLNASHGTRDDQTRRLKMLREIEQKVGQSIGTRCPISTAPIRLRPRAWVPRDPPPPASACKSAGASV